jgi:glycosyltransferase involved in cell wall biosynthesis
VLLLNQLRAIEGAGFGVTAVSAPGSPVVTLAGAGIRHIAVPFVRASGLTPLADLRAFLHLVRVFRRERFAIVHTHTAKPDLYAAIAARLAGVPIVVTTLHGFFFHDNMSRYWRRFYILLARLGGRFADVVLSQNPEDIDTNVRERVYDPAKMLFLGNGIDVERFARGRVDPAEVRRRRDALGIPVGAPVVGFVGRLVADKGIIELLQAARAVRQRFPEVRFLLVGMIDRAKRDVIQPEITAEYGLAEACVFTGHREDMPELYAMMDVLVLPSHREAFPRAPMEASAMGVPVIATDVRGCRTAVEHGRNGLLVPLKDAAALAGAIRSLLGDPGERARLGAEGRRLAVERFDERRVFEKVLATYARLLAARGLPVPDRR